MNMNIEVPPFPPSAEYFEAAFIEKAAFDFSEESPLGGSSHRIQIKQIALGRIAIKSSDRLVVSQESLFREFQSRLLIVGAKIKINDNCVCCATACLKK